MKDSLVIIPTYNEKENITRMVSEVFYLSPDVHLLIIDDGSPDGTAAIVKNLQIQFSGRLFLVERTGKSGLGTAYILGFKWALEKNYQFIFEMDCDFSHPPKDLLRLHEEALKGTAVVIGSRYCRGGKVKNWPIGRILMSYFASVYVRLITWMPVTDTTAGFVCYRKEFLEKLDFNKITFIGYAFQIEMKFAAWRLGFKMKEIPITFTDRVDGASKMSKGIFKEAILGVLKMKWKSLSQRNAYGK